MFSDQHIELMRKFQNGAEWYPFRDPEVDKAMHYLIEQGIITSDIPRGGLDTFYLTEHGKSVMCEITEHQREADYQTAKNKADDSKHAEERRQDIADNERQRIAANKTTIIASLVSAIIETVLPGVVSFVRGLFH